MKDYSKTQLLLTIRCKPLPTTMNTNYEEVCSNTGRLLHNMAIITAQNRLRSQINRKFNKSISISELRIAVILSLPLV